MTTNVTSVYIREYCTVLKCGGRMHRHLQSVREYADEHTGSENLYLRIVDQCDGSKCGAVKRPTSPILRQPARFKESVDKLFGDFSSGSLSRAQFDSRLHDLLRSHGASWDAVA